MHRALVVGWLMAVAVLWLPTQAKAADTGWAYLDNGGVVQENEAAKTSSCEYGVDHGGSPCDCVTGKTVDSIDDQELIVCENPFMNDSDLLEEFQDYFNGPSLDFSSDLPILRTNSICFCMTCLRSTVYCGACGECKSCSTRDHSVLHGDHYKCKQNCYQYIQWCQHWNCEPGTHGAVGCQYDHWACKPHAECPGYGCSDCKQAVQNLDHQRSCKSHYSCELDGADPFVHSECGRCNRLICKFPNANHYSTTVHGFKCPSEAQILDCLRGKCNCPNK